MIWYEMILGCFCKATIHRIFLVYDTRKAIHANEKDGWKPRIDWFWFHQFLKNAYLLLWSIFAVCLMFDAFTSYLFSWLRWFPWNISYHVMYVCAVSSVFGIVLLIAFLVSIWNHFCWLELDSAMVIFYKNPPFNFLLHYCSFHGFVISICKSFYLHIIRECISSVESRCISIFKSTNFLHLLYICFRLWVTFSFDYGFFPLLFQAVSWVNNTQWSHGRFLIPHTEGAEGEHY